MLGPLGYFSPLHPDLVYSPFIKPTDHVINFLLESLQIYSIPSPASHSIFATFGTVNTSVIFYEIFSINALFYNIYLKTKDLILKTVVFKNKHHYYKWKNQYHMEKNRE